MFEIKAYIRPALIDRVLDALATVDGLHGIAVGSVEAFAHAAGNRGGLVRTGMRKLEVNAPGGRIREVVDVLLVNARSGKGHAGDGVITTRALDSAIRVEDGHDLS